MNEASLAIRTPRGLAVVVGCSHPGVEKIVAAIERTADTLHSALTVERVAPGHCTSEKGFAVFLDRFKDRFDRAGLGAVVAHP